MYTSVWLVAFLALSLTACGSGASSSGPADDGGTDDAGTDDDAGSWECDPDAPWEVHEPANANMLHSPWDLWVAPSGKVYVAQNYSPVVTFDDGVWAEHDADLPSELGQNIGYPFLVPGIWGRGEDDLFVAEGRGSVAHYNGAEWSLVRIGRQFNDVWLADDGTGYATSYQGLWWFDGSAWSRVVGLEQTAFIAVWGSAVNDVYAVAYDGVLHFDGTSWTQIYENEIMFEVFDVWGLSASDVYFLKSDFTGDVLLRFDGAEWSSSPLVPPEAPEGSLRVTDVHGTDGDDIYVCGYIEEYTDDPEAEYEYVNTLVLWHFDGLQWEIEYTEYLGSQDWPAAIWVAGSGDVYLGLQQGLKTYDGSNLIDLWTSASMIEDISGSGPDVAYAVGNEGQIYRLSDGIWAAEFHQSTDDFVAVADNPNGNVVAVGDWGIAAHYVGDSWVELLSDNCRGITGIHGNADSVFLSCKNHRMVMEFDGDSWTEREITPIPEGDRGYTTGIWASEEGDIVVVGTGWDPIVEDGGGFVAWFDGDGWSLPFEDLNWKFTLNGVWGAGGGAVYAVGDGEDEDGPHSAVLKVDQVGASVEYRGFDWVMLEDVWSAGLDAAFAVTDDVSFDEPSDAIVVYDGDEWTPSHSCDYRVHRVHGHDVGSVYALGRDAEWDEVLLHYVGD